MIAVKAIINNSTCMIVSRERLTRGTVGKTMEAEFSAEWEGLAITATFEAGDEKRDKIYTGEPIVIPHEVLSTAGVSVLLGFQGAMPDGTIVKRTEKEWLNNVSETLDPAGVQSSEPTPDWTAQVQNIATEAKQVADSVRSDAQAGKFNGSAGDDGGWYTPAITQPDENTMRFAFTPSKEGMPAVPPKDITIPGGGGGSGEAGGYYAPAVDADGNLSWTASKADMPAVDGTNIKGPQGTKGDKGNTGATGQAGADGKSAYAYAVEGGYTGTEAEFAAKLAAEKFANPNALTFTGAVTGNYDGSAPLEVAIPSGEGGTGGGDDVFELIGEATSSGVSDVVGLTIPFDGSLYKTIIAYAYNLPAGNKKRIIIRKKKAWYDGSPLGWNGALDTYLTSMTNMNSTWGFFGAAIDVDGKLFTFGAAEANGNGGHGYFRFWPQSGALPTLSLSNCKFISLDCNSNSEILPDGCSLVVWGVRK